MPEARLETYRSVDGNDLKIWIFEPEGHKASDSRPAIVFFFGGGWRSGTPGQFRHQAKHLAARGMVAMSADYRVLNRQGVKGHKCVQDAKSAIRWARANAKRLGVDPNRLAAGGGSAGGHLAASTATLPDHDDPAGDKSISSKPNALALFNPGTVLASVPGKIEFDMEQIASRTERAGVEPESISPYHHVKSGFPPAISSSQNRLSAQDIGIIAIGFTGHGALVRSEPGHSESPAATRGPSARAWNRWAGRSWRSSGAGSRRSPAAGGRRRAL